MTPQFFQYRLRHTNTGEMDSLIQLLQTRYRGRDRARDLQQLDVTDLANLGSNGQEKDDAILDAFFANRQSFRIYARTSTVTKKTLFTRTEQEVETTIVFSAPLSYLVEIDLQMQEYDVLGKERVKNARFYFAGPRSIEKIAHSQKNDLAEKLGQNFPQLDSQIGVRFTPPTFVPGEDYSVDGHISGSVTRVLAAESMVLRSGMYDRGTCYY